MNMHAVPHPPSAKSWRRNTVVGGKCALPSALLVLTVTFDAAQIVSGVFYYHVRTVAWFVNVS